MKTLSAALSIAAASIDDAGCAGDSIDGEEGDVDTSFNELTKKCGASAKGKIQGYDVSVWQGNFSWSSKNVEFGYARVSDGLDYIDGKFDHNWKAMKKAGVLRGAYQFFRPSQDAGKQASVMVKKLGKLGAGDLPAAIDVEVTGGVSPSTLGKKIHKWLNIVEKGTGKRPIIYAGAYFWESHVAGTDFSKYPFWVAAWGPVCPSVPKGFKDWAIWQYSDGKGQLDHDVFNGSLAELKNLGNLGSAAPSNPTEETDTPEGTDTPEETERLSDCIEGGLYCGGDKLEGNENTLYRCQADGSAKKVEDCARGCGVRSGQNDACRTCIVGGYYCGGDMLDGDKNTLYRCGDDGLGEVIKQCSNGCGVHSGTDDSCN
jgi:GH25 family lysozyme M1 (1,4-beta-N-acetylmuramidase)